MKKAMVFVVLTTAICMSLHITVHAIRVCHDYTYYRVFRTDPDPPAGKMAKKSGYLSADALRQDLKKAGYKCYPVINSYQQPNFPKFLKPGYVVIIEDAHSGYINGNGNVDHFLQPSNHIGTYYTIKEIETKCVAPLKNEEKGGLFLDDTWKIFIGRRFTENPIQKIEVWRK
jgi:hypothetical protein